MRAAEAAVQAMAGAADLLPVSLLGWRHRIAESMLAALVASPDVRAALTNALCRCHDVPPGQRFGIRHFNSCPVADDGAAVLDALAGAERGERD